jgi:hypothetical protein
MMFLLLLGFRRRELVASLFFSRLLSFCIFITFFWVLLLHSLSLFSFLCNFSFLQWVRGDWLGYTGEIMIMTPSEGGILSFFGGGWSSDFPFVLSFSLICINV